MQKLLILLLLGTSLSGSAQNIYYFSEQGSGGRDLYSLDLKSGKKRKLSQKLGNGHYPHFINPKLSPDGKKLVFQCDSDGHDRYAIWTINVDGTDVTRITQKEGMYPNWSPDGKVVIFSGRRDGVWEILTVPANGGEEENLSNNAQKKIRPGWGATSSFHPNGESFVFSYIREKVLYSYDLKTDAITQLTVKGSYTHPIYSEDGSSILVNRKIEETYDLVIIKEGKEEVISESVVSYSAPDWYDKGRKLLFTGSINGIQQLFSIDLSTLEETQLTNNQHFDGGPLGY